MKDDLNKEFRDEQILHLKLENPCFGYTTVNIENFPVNKLALLIADTLLDIHDYPFYMHKAYDKVVLYGLNFIMTKITKKAVKLMYLETKGTVI